MRHNQWTKTPRTSLELILLKCEEDDYTKCLTWTGYAHNGYGRCNRNKHLVSVHREAYEEAIGPIPEGAVLHHLCRNKLCVNTDHLVCMSNADHVVSHLADTHGSQNRNKTHCIHGHEFTPENTRFVKGGRACKQCEKDRYASYRDRDRMPLAA